MLHLDPLSAAEISQTSTVIRASSKSEVKFNSITLLEPPKAEYAAFRDSGGPRPARRSLSIVIPRGTQQVVEVTVNLVSQKVEFWREIKDVMPILTLEDLDVVERISRVHPQVIKACNELGITDMSKVFFDGWAIGVDERWGFERRLQQALAYYRTSPSDNQYAHPLDFTVIADTEREEVLSVDIRTVNGERTPIPMKEHNYLPEFAETSQYKFDVLKPINITQPQGVSFKMSGREIHWANMKMHIGFNYREGLVLSDIRIRDPYDNSNKDRKIFNRLSVVEMFVPYGSPKSPHHRKHAFDIGEYGSGFMANSLKLGCDCKGVIQYLDAVLNTSSGAPLLIENAICIHEEDNGLLYKHTDFRDGRVISARDRKLVISQILTAANYEYAFYHTFTLDGTYKLEVKLTGMLNTYCLHESEESAPFGTEVAERLDAQNHQHIFSLRIDSEIDGSNNTVIQNDAVPIDVPTEQNPYGNGFMAKKTIFKTAKDGSASYCHETSRTWDIVNPNIVSKVSKKPVGYKIVNSQCPALLAKPDSVIAKRGSFAQKALWVLPYRDYELFPAGSYVCQSTGDYHPENMTISDWVARDEPIENTDIVCYVQFGLTHFPRTEDFPIMPAEPVSVMLRASNFFEKNPALWVPPSELDVDSSSTNANSDTGRDCVGQGKSTLIPKL
ncbi:copper amine oxidase [Penicillium robsamsonii]|uniref:copper amine oxidase n=1 Tax=Penicillium robsamsonii TaxID=1792511 RepID=UPI002546AD6F|nr:copper amine oxidase [Penicillium robsamsonii]KAJ5817633.1 copper amine oxidase [Penicillium robsamsonii]